MIMFGECHAHLLMDGVNYKKAVELHKDSVNDADIRAKFSEYAKREIFYVRDGGDSYGVSQRAADLAGEYGITYRTPVFAIHKKGHYGGIVGRAFSDWKEYEALVKEVRERGGNFIKVMFSGIMDFSNCGAVTEPPLLQEEIREMIHIAHEEGFAVMAHVNGAGAVQDAVEAGVDSVEHGNFMDEACLQALAESGTVWVPTFVTITNLIGGGRFDDDALRCLKREQGERIRRGFELGVKIALGSDAGAWRVLHGQGLLDEYKELLHLMTEPEKGEENSSKVLKKFVLTKAELDQRLKEAEKIIRRKF